MLTESSPWECRECATVVLHVSEIDCRANSILGLIRSHVQRGNGSAHDSKSPHLSGCLSTGNALSFFYARDRHMSFLCIHEQGLTCRGVCLRAMRAVLLCLVALTDCARWRRKIMGMGPLLFDRRCMTTNTSASMCGALKRTVDLFSFTEVCGVVELSVVQHLYRPAHS